MRNLNTNVNLKLSGIMSLVLGLVLVSCGSYSSIGSDGDGIYSSGNGAVSVETANTKNNNRSSYYQAYFKEKSLAHENAIQESEIFTDVDTYSSNNYVASDLNEEELNYYNSNSNTYEGFGGWGENPTEISISFNNLGYSYYGFGFGYPYYNNGFNYGFGYPYYGYGYGYGHYPYYRNNFAYGWGYPYYGYGWGYPTYYNRWNYGYGPYNRPYYNNRYYSYNNTRRGGGVAYNNNSRRRSGYTSDSQYVSPRARSAASRTNSNSNVRSSRNGASTIDRSRVPSARRSDAVSRRGSTDVGVRTNNRRYFPNSSRATNRVQHATPTRSRTVTPSSRTRSSRTYTPSRSSNVPSRSSSTATRSRTTSRTYSPVNSSRVRSNSSGNSSRSSSRSSRGGRGNL